jgi:hypothetical protein
MYLITVSIHRWRGLPKELIPLGFLIRIFFLKLHTTCHMYAHSNFLLLRYWQLLGLLYSSCDSLIFLLFQIHIIHRSHIILFMVFFSKIPSFSSSPFVFMFTLVLYSIYIGKLNPIIRSYATYR